MRTTADENARSDSPLRRVLAELSRPRHPLLAVGAVTLLAKGAALLPGYAIDDYGTATEGPKQLLADVLSKGRAGHWLFLELAMAFQVEPNTARILFVGFAILCYSLFGWTVVRFWRLPAARWPTVAAAAIVANHPYTAEIFTFRIGLPLAAIVVGLLALLLYLAARPASPLWLGALLFGFALSCYQIALHFALMVALMSCTIWLCRRLLPLAARPEPAREAEPGEPLLSSTIRFSAFIFLGGFLYYIAGLLFGRLMGVHADFFEVLALDRIPGRVREVAGLILRTFVSENVLIPMAVRALFGLVLAGFLGGLLWAALHRHRRPAAHWTATALLALLGGALLWSVGVYLFLRGYWPVPRSMAHVGVFWAGCLVLAVELAPWAWARRLLAVAAAPILVSFVGVNQHIFEEQRRLNVRDLLLANRIVARLEATPGFERVHEVAFVGGRAWYPMGLQRTQWGDMNISALAATWSQVALLREATGYDLQWANDPQKRAAAEAYCASAGIWPAEGSVQVRDGLAIICLESPRRQ